jgi:hypothetical protein
LHDNGVEIIRGPAAAAGEVNNFQTQIGRSDALARERLFLS